MYDVIYYCSVGKNSLLLLNLPPDKRGLIHEKDVKSVEMRPGGRGKESVF